MQGSGDVLVARFSVQTTFSTCGHTHGLLGSALAIEVVPLPREAPEIPHGHLPPPGECRVWHPNRPAGQEPPPLACNETLHSVPAGAWLLYRETPGTLVVTAYRADVPGLVLDTRVFHLDE